MDLDEVGVLGVEKQASQMRVLRELGKTGLVHNVVLHVLPVGAQWVLAACPELLALAGS